jgi:DNA-directed RNA polymerase specialized sigma24 family protein
LNDISTKPGLKRNWTLTSEAFAHLLGWLDAGSDSMGQSYLSMRSRLVTYFDRKDCPDPDELADEVLNRVGRRLEEEGDIKTETPAKYLFTVAKFVFMEHLRSPQRYKVSIEDTEIRARAEDPESGHEKEAMLACLDKFSASLKTTDRDLIVGYYSGEKAVKIANRKRLAVELGISLNALAIRAFRVREKLEACVTKCLENGERK